MQLLNKAAKFTKKIQDLKKITYLILEVFLKNQLLSGIAA